MRVEIGGKSAENRAASGARKNGKACCEQEARLWPPQGEQEALHRREHAPGKVSGNEEL
jgi:hypothetical protein